MIKLNYAFDYEYDWVVNRTQRLDRALRGEDDATKVIIPTTPDELAGAARIQKGGHQNSFLQPLPFFSIVNEAAQFVGLSKRGMDLAEKTEDVEPEKKPLKNQTMFVLDRRHTLVPTNPVTLEFEPGD
jgi:casein kinase 1 alpha